VPNIKSAIKRVKVTANKTNANKIQKSATRSSLKKANTAIETSADNVKEVVGEAIIMLDKAAGKGYMHKNTVARKKSKLAKAINAVK